VLDSEISNVSSFGIYYTGVNGSDCWLASGARLDPPNEWIAINTRATLLKLSNIDGGVFYFNTGLSIGASFIPTPQSTPGTTPIYGQWRDGTFTGVGPTPYVWGQEDHNEPSYFTRQTGDTEIKINIAGTYQISWNSLVLVDAVTGDGAITASTANLGNISGGNIILAPGSLVTMSGSSIETILANDVFTLTKNIGEIDPGSIAGYTKILNIKLLQS
jgi:hypothetical protein